MKYAIHRTDGGVSIMECVPVRAVRGDESYRIDGFKTVGGTFVVAIRSETQTGVLNGVSLNWELDGWTFECNPPEVEIAKWAKPLRDRVVSIQPITDADIPQDREFRDGWTFDGVAVVHDMNKCRELHKAQIRRVRAPMLASLDIEYQRADEAGDRKRKDDIAEKKQRLRDVTADPRLAAAKTVEELKIVWPI